MLSSKIWPVILLITEPIDFLILENFHTVPGFKIILNWNILMVLGYFLPKPSPFK